MCIRDRAENDGTGRVLISTASLRTLAEGWSETYGVKNGPFLFESYVKGWTEIDFLTCDYKLDTDAAVKELLHQLLLRQSGEIDAPLNCYRNGSCSPSAIPMSRSILTTSS